MHKDHRWTTQVRRLDASDGGAVNILEFELALPSTLHDGDLVLFTAGDAISVDGEVVEGTASIDASGRRVLSGWVAVRVTANHGQRLIDQ